MDQCGRVQTRENNESAGRPGVNEKTLAMLLWTFVYLVINRIKIHPKALYRVYNCQLDIKSWEQPSS